MIGLLRKIILVLFLTMKVLDVVAQTMEWLCHPGKYEEIEYVGYDLFKIRNKENKWGIISANGNEIIKTDYDSITSIVENRALILGERGTRILGIINQKGELLQKFSDRFIYTTAYPYYQEGLLSFKDENGLCGYLNEQGDIVINAKYYLAAPFRNGIATVQYADKDGYFGLINKSGGSAIISDTKYTFLSSLVDGYLFAVTSYSRGGDLLRIMNLKGNRLKALDKLESMMFVELSDDFSYLMSQNGNHYFIDEQWRITGSNYNLKLPYEIKNNSRETIETTELLSKHYLKDGFHITYSGESIVDYIFDSVSTFEKKYAIVGLKDGRKAALKLNVDANLDFLTSSDTLLFYHNPMIEALSKDFNNEDVDRYLGIRVDIRDINPSKLKFRINDNGRLIDSFFKKDEDKWMLYFPYFQPNTEFDNKKVGKLNITVAYDELDWKHQEITILSMHKPGYEVVMEEDIVWGENDKATIVFNVKPLEKYYNAPVRVEVPECKINVDLNTHEKNFSISEYVKPGTSKTLNYSVWIMEEGCPVVKRKFRKTIVNSRKVLLELD